MVLPHQRRRRTTASCTTQSSSSCQPNERCDDLSVIKASSQTCAEDNRCRQDEARCADLRIRYLALLDGESSESLWKDIWNLFITHQWVQVRLERSARSALRGSYMSDQWTDDVKQDVLVRLANKLRRIPDLRMDRTKAEAHFAGWLNAIILRDCRMAVRQLRRLHCRTLPLLEDRAGDDPSTTLDARIDLNQAMDELDETESSVLELFAQGYTIREIAAECGYSTSKAFRLVRHATDQVERHLRGGNVS